MTCAHNNRRVRQHVAMSPYRHADIRFPHAVMTGVTVLVAGAAIV
jgi:hypothetical protein